MKKSVLALALLAVSAQASALTTGDIAFTSFNADEDGFAMVALVDLAANTKIYFTDNEWDGSVFNAGESYSSWSSGAALISAGTVIRFNNIDSATLLGASVGTYSRESVSGNTNYGFSASEDSVYAYQASSVTGTPTMLAAISSTAFGTVTAGFLTNTSLAVGAGAVQLGGGAEFDEYIGLRSGQATFASYKSLVSNIANWTNNPVDGSYAANIPNTTAFTITAVPEASTYGMMLAGLGLVGFMARRRNSK